MAATQRQLDAPQAKSRRFRFAWLKLLVLTLLFAASGVGLAVWVQGLPTSWTADYDKERYTQIRGAIVADTNHLLGKSLDEVTKALSLEDVPWDDSAVQREPGMNRIYHFRGFALHITLQLLPPGITPDSNQPWSANGEELRRHGVLWLAHGQPFVQIDGINDRQERMKRFWKAVDEECERINARMAREAQRNRR
ncbi:MAG: hypothetical protein ACYC6Y_27280 [Thermoguttaceae bacterium]